jgi:hypothetical protein
LALQLAAISQPAARGLHIRGGRRWPAAWLVGGNRQDWENRGMELRWGDPEAPWWAKLRRAKSHISEVRQRVDVLQAAEPWSIQREPAGPDDGWAYRFRVHKPVPADLAAATGMRWPICAPRWTPSPTSWLATTRER